MKQKQSSRSCEVDVKTFVAQTFASTEVDIQDVQQQKTENIF